LPVGFSTGKGPSKQHWTTPKRGFKVQIKKLIGGDFAAGQQLGIF
jgi:hypothetical protein